MSGGDILIAEKLCCKKCKTEYSLEKIYKCPSCGGILDVIYDYKKLNQEALFDKSNINNGIWKYKDLLPINDENNIVTLGEGNTPLVKANNLNEELGIKNNIYLKLENTNPSGSFKDRPISVGISKAKEFNADTVVIASTGNASASTSAYAAHAGLNCVVCVPQNTSTNKVSQAIAHGAHVVYVEGSFSDSYKMAIEASEAFGWINTTTTFLNPYTYEGNKTVAYELWEQMNKKAPDAIIIPIGAGPLLVGMHKGFVELKKLGLIEKLPRLIGVQAEECAPIYEAFLNNLNEVNGWSKDINTVAKGIADPLVGYEDDGTFTLQSILESEGCVISLTEEEILNALSLLSTKEGVYGEPTSATSIGALQKLVSENKIENYENVVCIITGHGLKQASSFEYTPKVVTKLEELKNVVNIEK